MQIRAAARGELPSPLTSATVLNLSEEEERGLGLDTDDGKVYDRFSVMKSKR